MIHDETKKYEWDAVEFEHREKSTDWYWGLGIAVVAGCIICLISQNYLLAVLLLLGGVLLGFYANDKPHPVHVELSARGIKIDNDLYTHETMQSFWIYSDHRDRKRIILTTGRSVMPQRIITMPEDIPANNIRQYLLAFLEEKETKPSLIDLIAETIGV